MKKVRDTIAHQRGEEVDGFFFDEFLEYEIEVSYSSTSIHLKYNYSVGAAYSAAGLLLLDRQTSDIVNVENISGTGLGSFEVYVNGVLKLENSYEVEYQ